MNFFKKKERRDIKSWLPSLFDSNIPKPANANAVTTVYSSVRLIASVIADTPLKHFDKDEELDSDIALLLRRPNPNTTSFNFLSNITTDLLLKGNALVWIDTTDKTNLYYLPYDNISINITTDHTQPLYYIVEYFGHSYTFFPEEILHFKNAYSQDFGYGYIGLNPITVHRLLLDTAASQQEYLKAFNDNAASIQLVIETEKKLNADSIETFQKTFRKKFGGVKNAGNIPLLHDGLKAKQLTKISPLDADYINTHQMTKVEIAEIFGVPPSILGIGDQKYSNAEQAHLSFQNYTLSPMMTSIAQEFTLKLLPTWSAESILFKTTPLKYSSSKETSEALSLLRNSSIITPNEARKYFDLPALDGIANKLLETDNEIGDNQAAPKTTTDTNPDAGHPKTDSMRWQAIENEIQKIRSVNGRLQAQLKEFRCKN